MLELIREEQPTLEEHIRTMSHDEMVEFLFYLLEDEYCDSDCRREDKPDDEECRRCLERYLGRRMSHGEAMRVLGAGVEE